MPALLPEEETMTKTVADFMLECLAADPAAPHHQEPGEELCQGAPEGRSGSARHRLAYPRASPGLKSQSEARARSEEHTSELQSLMRISYAVFCLKKKKTHTATIATYNATTSNTHRTQGINN